MYNVQKSIYRTIRRSTRSTNKKNIRRFRIKNNCDISRAVNEQDIITTQIAVQLRPNLRRFIEETYSVTKRTLMSEIMTELFNHLWKSLVN